MIGEPDAGKPHVRFDEGVQETCDSVTRLCPTLPERSGVQFRWDEKAGPQWKSDTLSSKRTRLGARKDRLMKKNNTVKQSLKKGTKKTTKGAQESITSSGPRLSGLLPTRCVTARL